ncbi:MAG TPA: hypothetical protein VNI20_09015 [Fimbriimonadaceae bacterium]|nr:hypothetical protein [Fimbriimonadaceae bacterium]
MAWLLLLLATTGQVQQRPQLASQGLSGYISMSVPAPNEGYGYGVSLYATAWPLVSRPIRDFQIGLASIWIIPDNRDVNEPLLPHGTVARDNWPERGPSYRTVFETIEGGLGFWASTRFGSTTAKFRMNGTPNGYNHEISSPGWGFGRTQALKPDQMGIAQLSPWLLVPPDGLTFEKDTLGELFGYAWMALPLTLPKQTTAGLPVPTGNECWTMFVNAKNFRGPVACYTPVTWSRISRIHPPAVGRGLDARPGVVAGGAIEINTVPRFVAKAKDGTVYTRIPQLQFPVDEDGQTVLIHNLTHYGKGALWNQVEAWIAGGAAPSGQFDMSAARTPPVKAQPLTVHQGPDQALIKGCENWLSTSTLDATTFGLSWKPAAIQPWEHGLGRGTFPEFFKRVKDEWLAIKPEDVPKETGLADEKFPPAATDQSYVSPDTKDDVWHKPGPAAGPFTAHLSDGSVVTYYWYRFIDQPSLQDADLSDAEKARLQSVVEKIHRQWTKERQYLPSPGKGTLASLDPSLLVMPPKGMEVGYVPIVTRQSPQ